MGGNPAENHPCGFKWAIEAKRQRNAKMIVVDPRFTRTAATADLFLQIRAGADIAFLGGVIHYAHRESAHRQRVSGQFHQRGVHRQGGFQAAGRRPVFRLRRGDQDLRPVHLELRSERREPPSGKGVHGQMETAGTFHAQRRRGDARSSRTAAERRLRPVARTSALRLSVTQEAVLALHAGNGGAHHRHSQGSISESRRPVHFHPQRRRHEKGRDHYLRRRLDAAQLRHADHPHWPRCCNCCSAMWDARAEA